MGDCRVHNVRFYDVEAKAIHCMSYEPSERKLALSRSDSSIEIWNLRNTSFLEKVIPGFPEGSIEALAWCNNRLFSTGIHARVVEHNLKTLTDKYFVSVTAGPGWCLGINRQKTYLAAGTEEGYINLFSIFDDNLQYEKILDRQEGRILCLSWDSTGDFIATGSVDAVRIWNVHSGHALQKMNVGRSHTNKETIVWCIAVTDDFTVISGDSRGKICFWNGQTGVNSETYQSHEADVLCLALSEDQSTVYCSGVDPLIATFTRITFRSSGQPNGITEALGSAKVAAQRTQWCRSAKRRIHDHDVRALAICHDKLCSGGVDSYLAVSRLPKALVKYPPVSQAHCVMVCPKSRCILLRYTSRVEVWKLGSSEKAKNHVENGQNPNQRRRSGGDRGIVNGGMNDSSLPRPRSNQSSSLSLVENPIKLLELKSRLDEHIVCAAMSSDSRWLAYSTESLIRVYSVRYDEENKPQLEKISSLPEECGPAHRLKFTSNSSSLVLVSQKGQIFSFNLNLPESSITLNHALNKTELLVDAVHLLDISSNNQYIVAADHRSNIVVWKGKEVHCSLPRHACEPSALAISPCNNNIVVVYVDNKIVEYSLKDKRYTPFSRTLATKHPKQWLSRSFPVINVAFDPRDPQIIILHDDNTICVIDKRKELAKPDAKIPRLDPPLSTEEAAEQRAHPGTTSPSHAFHVIKRYKHLVYFGWLGEDEAVAVEVNPLRLMKQLPPAHYKKMFGM